MTYYDDLSPYEYWPEHEPPRLKPINVGWLGEGELFPTGETSQEFKAKLFELCLDEYLINIARGIHTCELCNISDEEWYEQNTARYGEDAPWWSLGNGEIRVIGQSAVYAAPTLIYHYVVEHNYKPPEEFIEAVLSGPPPGSKEHETLLKKYRTRTV